MVKIDFKIYTLYNIWSLYWLKFDKIFLWSKLILKQNFIFSLKWFVHFIKYFEIFKIVQRRNWQFLTDLVNCESDRLVNNQSFSPVIHEFSSANSGQPNAVDRICQWPNLERLDMSDGIVMTSSLQSIESTNKSTEFHKLRV